ncbi:hypothetical protein [uncultured Acinetobacter sp.]|uniref:hypothetical protein n=1 Tax=uncultured Acinetobacter sp. TaxID=165433 RepID=UPI003749BA2B
MLTYGTLRIFIDEKIEAISAFGSILSGIGTFFAAYAAIYIFNGWKVQANFDLKKEHVNQLSILLSMAYDEVHRISEILIDLNNIETHEVICENFIEINTNDLRVEFYKNIINAKMLDRLNTKNKEVFSHYAKYQIHLFYLVKYFNNIQNQYTEYYVNHISSIPMAQKDDFRKNGYFIKYKRTRSKSDIETKLTSLISHKVIFTGNNKKYVYNNITEMTKEMEEIYSKLEKIVLDSINLKLN